MGGPNLEKIRQILYDPAGTIYSPDLIEDLQLTAQRTIRPEEMCVFNEYDHIHFCFASRADFILPTFAATSEKLHDGNDVNACIISAPKAVFPFNAEGQTIILERLRRLLERFQYPIGLFPKELKHLLLIHAIMAKPEADDDSPKMTLDVRQDIVDGKTALVMTTVQVNPSTQLPYFTNIAILHNEPIEGIVDDAHPEWFEYRGLEQACENSSLCEEQRQIRLNLVKSIAQHTHCAMVKPDQLRWLIAQLSAMYNVSLLMRGIEATNARIHPSQWSSRHTIKRRGLSNLGKRSRGLLPTSQPLQCTAQTRSSLFCRVLSVASCTRRISSWRGRTPAESLTYKQRMGPGP